VTKDSTLGKYSRSFMTTLWIVDKNYLLRLVDKKIIRTFEDSIVYLKSHLRDLGGGPEREIDSKLPKFQTDKKIG